MQQSPQSCAHWLKSPITEESTSAAAGCEPPPERRPNQAGEPPAVPGSMPTQQPLDEPAGARDSLQQVHCRRRLLPSSELVVVLGHAVLVGVGLPPPQRVVISRHLQHGRRAQADAESARPPPSPLKGAGASCNDHGIPALPCTMGHSAASTHTEQPPACTQSAWGLELYHTCRSWQHQAGLSRCGSHPSPL